MKIGSLFISFATALMLGMTPASALSIDLGGVRIKLPTVQQKKVRPAERQSTTYSTHPRWATVVEGTYRMASNGQGIWIGYDDTGSMVMQLQFADPGQMQVGDTVSVNVEINGRYYRSVVATIASEHLAIVQGAEVEAILGRLKSGRTVAITLGGNRIETHLRGSSAAIGEVRDEAMIQARLFQAGRIPVVEGEPDTSEGEIAETVPDDSEITLYYLPGVDGYGVADVRFDLQEERGLVIFIVFEQIDGHEDPRHRISMSVSETERAIELIRKSEDWTRVAKENRVGLFSKRIGFVDDEINRELDSKNENEEFSQKDYRAVNFNSYENGFTSVQIEHSVGGYSRRFNFELDEALELADFLENTLKVRSQQFETRELSEQEKENLFQ